ncbi:MAG: hypothetical protein LBV49_01325 [Azonexus sp.]|jgi:hypothetical protein|nr:hypothetical protein [Azonexus sp.]
MKKPSIITLIFLILLSGCATSRSNYLGGKEVRNMESAVSDIEPLKKIELGKSIKIQISESSPILITENIRGRFETFELSGTKDKDYHISVAAICDCIGFRKHSIAPAAYLLDKDGAILSSGNTTGTTFQILLGKFPENGKYYFLVVADNRFDGERVGSLAGPMTIGRLPVPVDFSFPLTGQTTGSAFIHWEK